MTLPINFIVNIKKKWWDYYITPVEVGALPLLLNETLTQWEKKNKTSLSRLCPRNVLSKIGRANYNSKESSTKVLHIFVQSGVHCVLARVCLGFELLLISQYIFLLLASIYSPEDKTMMKNNSRKKIYRLVRDCRPQPREVDCVGPPHEADCSRRQLRMGRRPQGDLQRVVVLDATRARSWPHFIRAQRSPLFSQPA